MTNVRVDDEEVVGRQARRRVVGDAAASARHLNVDDGAHQLAEVDAHRLRARHEVRVETCVTRELHCLSNNRTIDMKSIFLAPANRTDVPDVFDCLEIYSGDEERGWHVETEKSV